MCVVGTLLNQIQCRCDVTTHYIDITHYLYKYYDNKRSQVTLQLT